MERLRLTVMVATVLVALGMVAAGAQAGTITASALTAETDIVNVGGTVIAAQNFGGTGNVTVNGIAHINSNSGYAPINFSGGYGDPIGLSGSLFTLIDGLAGTANANEPGNLTVGGLTPGKGYLFQAYWVVKDNHATRKMNVTVEGDSLSNIAGNPSSGGAVLISYNFTAGDDTFNGSFTGTGGDENGWICGFSLQSTEPPPPPPPVGGHVAARHWVGDDYAGSGNWANRNAAFSDAAPDPTSEGNRNNLPVDGVSVNAHDSVFFNANDDGNLNTGASFEVSGTGSVPSGGTNPTSGARAISFTNVFQTRDGVGGRGGPHWANSGLFGNERPGGNRGDWGLTYEGADAQGFQSDTEIRESGGSFNDNQPHIVTYTIDNNGVATLWVDGQKRITGTANYIAGGAGRTLETGDSGFSIGASTGAGLNNGDSGFIHGDMVEGRIDSFESVGAAASGNLNEAQTVVLHNHLSSKYGAAMLANDFYAGDTGANGDYDHGVFGIAGVGADRLDFSDDSWLTSLGSSGLSLAELNESLANGEAVMAGHADFIGSTVPATSLVTTDLPPGVASRVERTWFVQETGDVDFTMTFDLADMGLTVPGGSGFVLLTADSPGLNFTAAALTAAAAGDEITFDLTGYDLPANGAGYVTLGIAGQPGAEIPEPATMAALALAVCGLGGYVRKRKQRA